MTTSRDENKRDSTSDLQQPSTPRSSATRVMDEVGLAACATQYIADKCKQTAEVASNALEQSGKALTYAVYTVFDKTTRLKRPINALFFQPSTDAEYQALIRQKITEISDSQLQRIREIYYDIKRSHYISYESPETEAIFRKVALMSPDKRATEIFNYIFTDKGSGTDFRKAVIDYLDKNVGQLEAKHGGQSPSSSGR